MKAESDIVCASMSKVLSGLPTLRWRKRLPRNASPLALGLPARCDQCTSLGWIGICEPSMWSVAASRRPAGGSTTCSVVASTIFSTTWIDLPAVVHGTGGSWRWIAALSWTSK